MTRDDEVQTVLKYLQQIGLAATETQAEAVLSLIDGMRIPAGVGGASASPTPGPRALTRAGTSADLALSPASNDAPSAHADLSRLRDPNIIAQEVATGTRSA